MSQRNDANKLFVGCLPADITAEELKIVFSTYGAVADIHVMAAQKSTTGNACAFVCYENRSSGEDAIMVLDKKYKIRTDPDAQEIRVSWARQGGGRDGKDKGDKGSGKDAGGKDWGGGKQDSWNSWSSSSGSSWGGSNSWSSSNDSWSGSSSWSSSGGGSWQDRGSSWNSGGGSDHGSGQGKDGKGKGGGGGEQGNRLFVGNLPAEIQQDALEYVFGNYGKVVKVHIMVGRSKSGQSCAFIEYSTDHEAEVAIATLNDKYEIKPGDGNIMVKRASNDKGKGRSNPY